MKFEKKNQFFFFFLPIKSSEAKNLVAIFEPGFLKSSPSFEKPFNGMIKSLLRKLGPIDIYRANYNQVYVEVTIYLSLLST